MPAGWLMAWALGKQKKQPKSPKWKWDTETIKYCEKHNLPLPPPPPTNELLREGNCKAVSMIEEF